MKIAISGKSLGRILPSMLNTTINYFHLVSVRSYYLNIHITYHTQPFLSSTQHCYIAGRWAIPQRSTEGTVNVPEDKGHKIKGEGHHSKAEVLPVCISPAEIKYNH